MQWLIANIWMALAAFGVLGILFGSAMRGLFSENKVRGEGVDRDSAKTELDQTRVELDELYAAQRKRQDDSSQAVSGDESMATELAEREAKITGLGDELTAARSELDVLKAERESGSWSGKNAASAATAAAAGAIGGAALAGGDDEAVKALEERNAWLEERVAALETEISTAPAVLAGSDGEAGTEKLQWQNDHLRQRVEALEDELAALPASGAADNDGDGSSEVDEELARQRWRNRYLEKQVAYHEGDEEGAAAGDDRKGGLIAGAAAAVGTALVSDPEEVAEQAEEIADAVDEIAGNAAEAVDDTVEEALEDAESFEDVIDDIAQVDEHPSDAVLKELGDEIETVEIDQVQPEQADAPADGGGDDLTEIVGIGPRIAEVLNELGIWSFGQIAAWTPENAAWVEQHLSFKGRVEREGWIEQAKDLLDGDKA
ncbi:MAG: hypothetical protein L3J02_03815 [Henriciella sp.]|nr:hypothetical protein [Henriciella sp.]